MLQLVGVGGGGGGGVKQVKQFPVPQTPVPPSSRATFPNQGSIMAGVLFLIFTLDMAAMTHDNPHKSHSDETHCTRSQSSLFKKYF